MRMKGKGRRRRRRRIKLKNNIKNRTTDLVHNYAWRGVAWRRPSFWGAPLLLYCMVLYLVPSC